MLDGRAAGNDGTGIARDAAGRGWKVLLCDKADLGGATSSASTKLVHGGLRYLEYYEFRLVREALRERNLLLRNAPHYVKPLPTTIPIFNTDRFTQLDGTLSLDWSTGTSITCAVVQYPSASLGT